MAQKGQEMYAEIREIKSITRALNYYSENLGKKDSLERNKKIIERYYHDDSVANLAKDYEITKTRVQQILKSFMRMCILKGF